MSQALCFNDVTLSPVPHQNSLWIRAAELARAIGYASEKSIANIYKRHESEFSNDMSVVINLSTTEIPVMTRIFSLRGCHLIAMFARTPVAKQFRRWVLDVLDRLAVEERVRLSENVKALPDTPLTPDQQCTLQAVVKGKVESIPEAERPKGLYPQIWSRFNNHFRIAKYAQLPQCRLSEGIAYLVGMEIKAASKASRLHLRPRGTRSVTSLPSAPSAPSALLPAI